MRSMAKRLSRFVSSKSDGFCKNYTKDCNDGYLSTADRVRVEVQGGVRSIVLERPASRNAVDLDMVRAISRLLREWESADEVQAVTIRGGGTGSFCAGGDVRKIVDASVLGDTSVGLDFFRGIYELVYQISTYKKPFMSILDGIVMGGGGGISVNGPVRVSTENSVFAMPEANIGFFPDVGASLFLQELPGLLGRYLALTGARIQGNQLLESKVATHMIPSKCIPTLLESMNSFRWEPGMSRTHAFDESLDRLKGDGGDAKPAGTDGGLMLELINKHFAHSTVEGIIWDLQDGRVANAGGPLSQWYVKTLEQLGRNSPLSLKVTLRQFQEASKIRHSARSRTEALSECLKMDCRLMQRFMLEEDFIIGVRAVLVDKSIHPKWKYRTLDQVTDEMVDSFFSSQPGDLELCGVGNSSEDRAVRANLRTKL